ncbi:uncharacterized protein E0L32_011229 [Thyridium curvatum]|uniref:Abscission/NoCut checkpoint regulator n=1 Tax=Thyridium curvatum TaxID=1093900 RepID=A0A507BQC4_9PEZI|nr:uncharacterized protein E0L32_011229 [Thyridium curvatum]TPX19068.1 hypothetical protein E0L32_011229 [Thyridium curvatum]
MADPSASDRDLLERLNALKPTSVTLDASQNSLGIPIPGSAAVPSSQPASREDALTARLRSLRLGSSSPSPSPSKEAASAASPRAKTQSPDVATTPCKNAAATAAARPLTSVPASLDHDEDKDPLHMDDEEVLNDFLEGLSGDEDFGPASAAAAAEPEDEADKVAALLESLGREASRDRDPATPGKADKPRDDDDDDSEGEEMQSEVSRVLARAADEAELDRISREQDGGAPDRDAAGGDEQTEEPAASPPQPTAAKLNSNPQSPPEDPFSLPSVPSTLPPPPPTDADADHQSFESSIAARMAALQGVAPDDDGGTNTLGLPSAPTFAPDARPPSTAYRRTTPAGRQAYTDEDERAWCVVCLEDAAVRCLGCGGDVYCARCFRDMHVGPAAGYDERGHRSVRFERGPRGSR